MVSISISLTAVPPRNGRDPAETSLASKDLFPRPRWRAKPTSSWSVDRCEGGRHGGGLGTKLREKLCLFQEKKKKVLSVQGGAVM